MNLDWSKVGAIAPQTLGPERIQLHHAAWILGSVASTLIPTQEDDSHSSLVLDRTGTLTTLSLDDAENLVISLAFPDLELACCRRGEAVTRLSLLGRTLDEALAWAGEVIRDVLPEAPAIPLRHYPDFPASPLAAGTPFQVGDSTARGELGRWFRNASSSLAKLAGEEPGASPIRVWPHHFDIGMLIDLGNDRGLGIGMSPGDAHHAEPYFYVYGYPYPEDLRLPPFERSLGAWTTTGFTGALLLASQIARSDAPQESASGFLREATAHYRTALGFAP